VSSKGSFDFYLRRLFGAFRIHEALAKMVDAELRGFALGGETVERALVESHRVNFKILGCGRRGGF